MKKFALASVTAALIITSSPAMADCHNGYSYVRGGYNRPGIVVRVPGLEFLPRVLLPSPAVVYAPRVPAVTYRHAPVATHHHAPVSVRPAPAHAPVVVSAPEHEHPRSGDGRPSKPDGNGHGGKRPSKPSR